MASASASCFAPRSDHGGGWSYGGTRGVPSPRRGAARRLRRVLARSGGGGGGGGRGEGRGILDPLATPLQILGLDASASYTAAQLKAAFRARVVYRSLPPPLRLVCCLLCARCSILSNSQGCLISFCCC